MPDNSVHLMITSPPYNVETSPRMIPRMTEDLSLDEYLDGGQQCAPDDHLAAL